MEVKGSHRDFTGTWWASIALPALSSQVEKWVQENLKIDERIMDTTICKNCLTFDAHVSVLLGLKDPSTTEMVNMVSKLPRFQLEFGTIKAFDLETKYPPTESGKEYKYQVLYIEILPTSNLMQLQEVISDTNGGVSWHHPKYNPHITVSFVKEGVADKLIGKTIPLNRDSTIVDKVTIKKFQDKSFSPLNIHLSTP